MPYEHLEWHRPEEDAVLQFTMTFARLGTGEPHFTEALGRASERAGWPVTAVAALPEALLLQVDVPMPADIPVELAMLGVPLRYQLALAQMMFGEAGLTSAATFVTCTSARAGWKGTAHWAFATKQDAEQAPHQPPVIH